jgi:hypothetical protein
MRETNIFTTHTSTPTSALQLIDYVASKTSLRRRDGAIGKVAQQAKLLAVASLVGSAGGG